MMEKRVLGKTGVEVSLLGFGGFHLCEIPYGEAEYLLNQYLDQGGNYIETAPSYGNGESEIKIGKAVSHRRKEYILATKAHDRDYEGCKKTINQSLANLQTDYVDILLMHAIDSTETLKRILAEDGAIKAAEEAKKEGKVKHIGLSMHGHPESLITALHTYPFEVVMTTINYFDVCNFPDILGKLLPLAKEKNVGVIIMKPLADGYLYKHVEQAFTYAFNQDVSIVVTGMNTRDMLDIDFGYANNYKQMTDDAIENLMQRAEELGNYVCRQCGKCLPCQENINIPYVFFLEALYDRQMVDGTFGSAADYALKERLKHWFGTKEKAIELYQKIGVSAKACTQCGECLNKCPYHIDIIKKLKNIDYKLDYTYGKIMV
ncbi:aldo/keto reductase [Vallitalea pronyensis]|nr:aldo/keto reductase [Vallitalea pronyensis]